MTKRRRRSLGGKDGNNHYQPMKKREVLKDVSMEKVSAQPDCCSSSSNDTRSIDNPTSANVHDHPLVASSQELSSAMQQIKLSATDSRPENESKEIRETSGVARAARKSSKGRSLRRPNKRKCRAKENSSQKLAASVADKEDDEVVHNSQEAVDPPVEPADEKLLKEPAEILTLYKRLTGIERKPPEKVEDPLRNEYRLLFCVGTICENLSNIMSARLASAGQLRKQRLDSLAQLKALTSRLEEMNNANSAIEKYLCFDDAAQRDALEVMNIRYEELCDDIFGADDEFLSMFEKEASNAEDRERSFTQPGSSPRADIPSNYAAVCMESKLTEVGLRYVDKMYEQIKQKNAEVEKYRSLIAQHNNDITSTMSDLIRIHEELSSLAPVVDTVVGVSPSEYSRASMAKTRSS